MSDREHAPLVRTNALVVRRGVTSFGGSPFTGVGVEVTADGRCELYRYEAGQRGDRYRELAEMLDLSNVVDDAFAEYADDDGPVVFDSGPFTGTLARFDGPYLRRLDEHEHGEETGRHIRWFHTGSLEQVSTVTRLTSDRFDALLQTHSWTESGQPRNASIVLSGADVTGSRLAFDETGRVSTLSVRSRFFDHVADVDHLIHYWSWTSVDQLHRLDAASQLTIEAAAPELQQRVVDALAIDGGLDAMTALDVVPLLRAGALGRLLASPALTDVRIITGDRDTYDALLAFKRRRPDATVEIDRVAILDASAFGVEGADRTVSAHFYDAGFTELIRWQQWTDGLTDDEYARLETSPTVTHVDAFGPADPDGQDLVSGQMRRLKAARPDIDVRFNRREIL